MVDIPGHRPITAEDLTVTCQCGVEEIFDGMVGPRGYVQHHRDLFFWSSLEPTEANLSVSRERAMMRLVAPPEGAR